MEVDKIGFSNSDGCLLTLFISLSYLYLQLIFSLARYEAVIDAYLDGLEASGLNDLSRVTSVASFFVSRVDTLIDKILEKIGTPEALNLRGKVSSFCLPN
jgi:transaldolase